MCLKIRILLVFVLSWTVLSCQDSITIEPSFTSQSCNFQYQTNSTSCVFRTCLYRSSSASAVQQWSWIQCYDDCCGYAASSITQGDSISMLMQCQTYNANRKRLLIGLTIGLIFSLIALIITIIICFKFKACPLYKWRESMNRKNEQRKEETVSAPTKDILELGQNTTNLQLQNSSETVIDFGAKSESEMGSKLLNFDLKKNIRLMRCKCCVCQSVKPQCYLTCNHYFHINCIGIWLQRHKFCPSCGTKQLRFVHIYCIDCRESLKVLPVSKFMAKFKRSSNFRCQKCQQENN